MNVLNPIIYGLLILGAGLFIAGLIAVSQHQPDLGWRLAVPGMISMAASIALFVLTGLMGSRSR